MQILFFDDDAISQLYPVTLTRSGCDIFFTGTSLFELAKKYFTPSSTRIVAHKIVLGITLERHKNSSRQERAILFLNSALAPSVSVFGQIEKMIRQKKEFVAYAKRRVLAAYLERVNLPRQFDGSSDSVVRFIISQKAKKIRVGWPHFQNLWDIIFFQKNLMGQNLQFMKKDFSKKPREIFVGKNVQVGHYAVIDASGGPVIIDSHVTISPFVVIVGPCFIGQESTIQPFTFIRPFTSIGKHCKVGGEVNASIISDNSNKAHNGYLGYSYLGDWVNIGAGTSCSNLKNSFGSVKMSGKNTGLDKLGCVIADYAKVAINSSLYSGKVVGVHSTVYGILSHDVPSFSNSIQGKEMIEFDLKSALVIQQRILKRKKKVISRKEKDLLHTVFLATRMDRKQHGVVKRKFSFAL